jgi:hypothetical protein
VQGRGGHRLAGCERKALRLVAEAVRPLVAQQRRTVAQEEQVEVVIVIEIEPGGRAE